VLKELEKLDVPLELNEGDRVKEVLCLLMMARQGNDGSCSPKRYAQKGRGWCHDEYGAALQEHAGAKQMDTAKNEIIHSNRARALQQSSTVA